jgi:hypothetical protein
MHPYSLEHGHGKSKKWALSQEIPVPPHILRSIMNVTLTVVELHTQDLVFSGLHAQEATFRNSCNAVIKLI